MNNIVIYNIDEISMIIKNLSEWNSGFVRWVILRHPTKPTQQNGFMGGFIFGERGTGKSTYCYKTLAKTYYELNGYNNDEDAYKMALQYIIFEPPDFRKLLIYNKIKKIVTPIICLDDASMHFGKMMHMINPKLYQALLGETATIRTAVTGFLINAPKRDHVAKFLRDYDDFKGQVKVDDGGHSEFNPTWQRKVRYYRWNYYPDEVKYRIQIPFQDKYSCYIPEPFYSWYIEKKNYFELKHEIEIADTIDRSARNVFIKYVGDLPVYPGYPDLKEFVKKWENEAQEEELQKNIETIEEKMRQERLKKKIQKYREEHEQREQEGNLT